MIRVIATNPNPVIPYLARIGPTWGTVENETAQAIEHLSQTPREARGIYITSFMLDYPAKEVARLMCWPNERETYEWWKTAFQGFKAAGIFLRYIIVDEGNNLNYADFSPDLAPSAQAGIGCAITVYAYQQTVTKAHREVFGTDAMAVRYGDIIAPSAPLDKNGYPMGLSTIGGFTCCEGYSWSGNMHSKNGTLSADETLWRSYVDSLNRQRICFNPVLTVASIGWYDQGPKRSTKAAYLDRERMKHWAQLGYEDRPIIWWNPDASDEDCKQMAAVVDALKFSRPRVMPAPVSLDAKSVTTGSETTTYAAYGRVK